MHRDTLLLFPGALGDFICFWPTLEALRQRALGITAVVAKPAVFALLSRERVQCIDIDRREIGDLFAASSPHPGTLELLAGYRDVYSWTGHATPGFTERLALITGASVFVHAFRAFAPQEHAGAYYARCAGVRPQQPSLRLSPDAVAWAAALWERHGLHARTLVVHAGSGSRRKNWDGMAAVAASWRAADTRRGKVLQLIGPADEDSKVDAADVILRGEPLDRVAAVLQRATLYVGNDSGISHLAGIAGVAGVVTFGATDPIQWAPQHGRLRIARGGASCESCPPERFCCHRLPVDLVWEALRAASGSPSATASRPVSADE